MVNHLRQKETIQNFKSRIGLVKLQHDENINTISKRVQVVTDIPDKANVIEYRIVLIDKSSIRFRPHALPHTVRKSLKMEIQYILNYGIIFESKSLCASPIVTVKKEMCQLKEIAYESIKGN